MHCIAEECKAQGITESLTAILGEALFAQNALNTVGGYTPYQAVYGRQPGMLPPIQGKPQYDSADGRAEQRIREIAIQSMTEASAKAQLYRATKAIAQKYPDYKKGEMVDFWRAPSSKDVTGWHGPVRVVEARPKDGQVICRIGGQERPCRLQDVRCSLLISFVHFTARPTLSTTVDIWLKVRRYVEAMTAGSSKLFDTTFSPSGNAVVTDATRKETVFAQTLHFSVQNRLTIDSFSSIRVGRGLRQLRQMQNVSHHWLFYWTSEEPQLTTAEIANENVDLSELLGLKDISKYFMTMVSISDCSRMVTALNGIAEQDLSTNESDPASSFPPGHLETIAEGSPADATSEHTAEMILRTYFTTGADGTYSKDLEEAAESLGLAMQGKETLADYNDPLQQWLDERARYCPCLSLIT